MKKNRKSEERVMTAKPASPDEPLLWEYAISSLSSCTTRESAYNLLFKIRYILSKKDFISFTDEVVNYIQDIDNNN